MKESGEAITERQSVVRGPVRNLTTQDGFKDLGRNIPYRV